MVMSYDRLCAENESGHVHFDPLALCPTLRYPVPQVQQYAPCGRLMPRRSGTVRRSGAEWDVAFEEAGVEDTSPA